MTSLTNDTSSIVILPDMLMEYNFHLEYLTVSNDLQRRVSVW